MERPILAQTPTALNQTIRKARSAFQAGRYAEAEGLWRKVVDQQPNSAEAFYELGFSLHLQEEIGAAIASYQKALSLDPNYDTPYINLGLAFIELMQYDKADQAFQKVLSFPDQPETPASTHALAHYNLAIIHKRQDNLESARQHAQSALTLAPEFQAAQALLQQIDNPEPEE
ncbi:MAG: tetratricopeptide repeat protein [Cyanobacteria bacterium P01_A01_bin.17]